MGQAGLGLAGLQPQVLNLPSSLLPLHLTHADPQLPPGSHEPQCYFFWLDWGVFIRNCHLPTETLVALRMGGSSLCIRELGATPAQGFSLEKLLLLPGMSTTSSEGTKLKHRLSHKI